MPPLRHRPPDSKEPSILRCELDDDGLTQRGVRQPVCEHDPSLFRCAFPRARPGDVHDVVVLEAAGIAHAQHLHGDPPRILTQNPSSTPRRILRTAQAEEQRDTEHGPSETLDGEGTGA